MLKVPVKPIQFLNAPSPICVTESGINTLVRPIQLANADV